MISDSKSALIGMPTRQGRGPVGDVNHSWKTPSTITTVTTATVAAVLLLLSPQLGIAAAIGGVAVGAVSAAISLARPRVN